MLQDLCGFYTWFISYLCGAQIDIPGPYVPGAPCDLPETPKAFPDSFSPSDLPENPSDLPETLSDPPRGLNWPLWGSKWLLWGPGCTGCHHIHRAKYQQNNRATNHISLSLSFWIHLESSLSYFTFLPPFPAPLYLCQLVCCCLLVCLSLFSTFYLSILPLIFKSISGWLKL